MITNKEIADKRNEVLMLRLQINEHKERRRLVEIEQLELDDVLPSRNELTGKLESVFAVNRRQEDTIDMYKDAVASQNKVLKDFQDEINKKDTTIDELNETIGDLRMAASDMLDTINECARGEAEDSRVLMQVVEAVKIWEEYQYTQSISQIANIVEDYLDAPEGPIVTLRTPSIGTRVVSKNEDTHIIDEAKMRAVHALIGCGDKWVLHLGVDAGEVAKYNQTVDELTETTRKLEGRLSSMYAANSDQDTTINKLNALLADGKMTLAAYRSNPLSDQVADRDNRIEQLMVLNEALRVDMELAHNLSRDHIAGQDRFIEELKNRIGKFRDEVSMLPENFWVVVGQLRDTNRRQTITIEELTLTLAAYREQNINQHNKLEKIEKIAGPSVRGCGCTRESVCRTINEIIAIVEKSTPIDEITEIIQEE